MDKNLTINAPKGAQGSSTENTRRSESQNTTLLLRPDELAKKDVQSASPTTLVKRKETRQKQYRTIKSNVHVSSSGIWQEYPPRLISYRASNLHAYGWFPLFTVSWSATVFGSPYIHFQFIFLLAIAIICHTTGLGMPAKIIGPFIRIWGTPFLGAIFNLSMIVTFIVGFFVTLVVNRWWSIRSSFAKIQSTTVEAAMMVATSIPVQEGANTPASAIRQRTRTELVRLINLAHVLVTVSADQQTRRFRKGYGLKTIFKKIFSKRSSAEDYDAFGNVSRTADVGKEELIQEGLVNSDEYDLLVQAEQHYGVPSYTTVYQWLHALVQELKKQEALKDSAAMLTGLTARLHGQLDATTTIFTFINSQLPYVYVHLVSLSVHIYLLFQAFYLGLLMHNGFPAAETVVPDPVWGLRSSYLMCLFMYVVICLSNALFQGMLELHAILDNPFGSHPCDFPLRAQLTDTLNVTRGLLKMSKPSFQPGVFQDLLKPDLSAQSHVSNTATPRAGDADQKFEAAPPNLDTGITPTALTTRDTSPTQMEQDDSAASTHHVVDMKKQDQV